MYLQEIVEVAIGLIFAWLLLSIAVLQIQEAIAAIFNKRARDLEATIGNMLKSNTDLIKFYEHPLIQGLMEPLNKKQEERLKAIQEKEKAGGNLNPLDKYRQWAYYRKPAYIPAQNFATALFDIIISAGTENSGIMQSFKALQEEVNKLKEGDQKLANQLISGLITLGQTHAGAKIDELKKQLRDEMLARLGQLAKIEDDKNNKPLENFANELKEVVNGEHPEKIALLLKSAEPYLDQVRRGAVKSGSIKLGEALNSLLSGMEEYATNTDKAIALGRKNVEEWFDNTMDRMGGWYKRWAQKGAFIIAFIIAVILNVDSIYIVQELWRNPASRQASTVFIQKYVEQKTEEGAKLEDTDVQDTINNELQKLNFPAGWKAEEYLDPGNVKDFLGLHINTKWFTKPGSVIISCPLFDKNPSEFGIRCYELNNPSGINSQVDNGYSLAGKLTGFFITALAAMLGAPFWFDVLKKLINIRSSGINPAEKPKEETAAEK